jgi:MurNAc alpha-1-phosphate uridylyltransferase
MPVDRAMIFAAGFGTRMKPLTDTLPKPLIEVAGKPLIDHALGLLDDISTIVVNTHYRADQMEAHLQGRGVTCIRETPEVLETGGGLKNALPVLGDAPLLTLNADVVFAGDNPVAALQNAWDPARMDALLMLIPLDNTVEYSGTGDFFLNDSLIERRGARKAAPYVYGSVQIIKTDLLAEVAEKAFSLNVIWDRMIAQGRAYGLPYGGRWVDVGRPEGIAVAEQVLRDV